MGKIIYFFRKNFQRTINLSHLLKLQPYRRVFSNNKNHTSSLEYNNATYLTGKLKTLRFKCNWCQTNFTLWPPMVESVILSFHLTRLYTSAIFPSCTIVYKICTQGLRIEGHSKLT